jgi:hypothetical protein
MKFDAERVGRLQAFEHLLTERRLLEEVEHPCIVHFHKSFKVRVANLCNTSWCVMALRATNV